MTGREQKTVNVYGEGTIQTVQTALDQAKAKEDVETEGEALQKIAFSFMLAAGEEDAGPSFDSETLENGISAAMDEPHVQTVEGAMEELAAAYTGKWLR